MQERNRLFKDRKGGDSTNVWNDSELKYSAGIVLYEFIHEHLKEERKAALTDFINKRTAPRQTTTVFKGTYER